MDPKDNSTPGVPPHSEGEAEQETISLPLDDIMYALVTPEGETPNIVFALTDGRFRRSVYNERGKFEKDLKELDQKLSGASFCSYGMRLFFRLEYLREFKKQHTSEFGHHLLFIFTEKFRYPICHATEEDCDKDYRNVLSFLSGMQNTRANSPFPNTKQ